MTKFISPFRYPGGKSQLYDFVNNILSINNISGTYIEPFAGGAGLALKLLVNNQINNIWINDYDKSIYSVWYAILNMPNELIERIETVPFDCTNGSLHSDKYNLRYWQTIKSLHSKSKHYQNSIDNAFSTLMLNRLNISGIINGGFIGGQKQDKNKIYARFNKKELVKRIKLINSLKPKIKLTRLDAEKMIPIIKNYCQLNNSLVFFDPPYFKQGKKLYLSFFDENKHARLAKLILSEKNMYWITTYDNNKEILDYYQSASKKYRYLINYSANNKKKGQAPELLFASKTIKLESFNKTHLINIQ